MASFEQQFQLVTEEIGQLNAKLDDVSEKIDDQMCKAEHLQNAALLDRLTKKEERFLAEKELLLKLRNKLLTDQRAPPVVNAPAAAIGSQVEEDKKEEEEKEEEEEREEEKDNDARWELVDSRGVEDKAHRHPLKRYRVHYIHFVCDVCRGDIADEEVVYGCQECDFMAHDACHKEGKYGEDSDKEDDKRQPIDSRTVQDPCHLHPLKCYITPQSCDVCKALCDERKEVFYCKECDFGTHFTCLTADLGLPPKLTDLRHPHPLVLRQKPKRGDLQGRYECAVCRETGRTWSYECDSPECDYKMHPQCVLVNVKGHSGSAHWFALAFAEKSTCALPNCNLIGTRGYVLRCSVKMWKTNAACDADLHPECANKLVAPYSAKM